METETQKPEKKSRRIKTHLENFRSKYNSRTLISIVIFTIIMIIWELINRGLLNLNDSFIFFFEKISFISIVFLCVNLLIAFFTYMFSFRVPSAEHKESNVIILQIIKYVIYITGGFFILNDFDIDIKTIGLGLGVFSAGIAIALQQPITSILGWFVIKIKKPLSVGDRIIVKDLKGDVEKVDLFHTTLREFGSRGLGGDDPTGVLIIVPNSIFLTEPILNYTKDFPYIWDEVVVSITYESDHIHAKEIMLKCAKEIVGDSMEKAYKEMHVILKDSAQKDTIQKEPAVFINFKDSYVEMRLKYCCSAWDIRRVKSEIYFAILEELKKHDEVQIAYPHMEVITHHSNKPMMYQRPEDKNIP